MKTIQPGRDEQSLLEVAHRLYVLTGIGYRVSSDLSGATSDGVSFHTDYREIGSCQGCTNSLNSNGGICIESIDQISH